MMVSKFFVSDDKLRGFCADGTMGDQEGVYLSYVTDPDAIRAILPPMLEPVAPVVTMYIINMGKPTFTSQYNEAALMIQAKYEDVVGTYFPSLVLVGPGAEMGMAVGRDVFGLPKKLGSAIDIRREDDDVKIQVVRHENTLLKLHMKIGECNDPMGTQLYGNIQMGESPAHQCLVFRYRAASDEAGNISIDNVTLDTFKSKTVYHAWETASIEEIEFGGGSFDPWNCLPVVKPLGGGYGVNDNIFLGSETLAKVDAGDVFPYIFKGFYDMGTISTVSDQSVSVRQQ